MKLFISILIVFILFFSGATVAPEREGISLSHQRTIQEKGEKPVVSEPLMLQKALGDERCQQWVDSLMNKLTLKEKIGQLFIYTIAPLETKRNLALLNEVINTYKVGGLLFSGGRMESQVMLTNRAQKMSKIPLLITFDGEWGLAMRLKGTPAFPRNRVLGCIQDNSLLHEYGREMARQCRLLGIQVNFAPVADVNINPLNPVINRRSFGENPADVADKVIAYASGLEEGGILSVCKHFPGHGDTDVDSHKALPLLPFTRERLDSVELYPFRKAIHAGLGGMMVGHLEVPALEPREGVPSSLSRQIVHNLLAEELSFKGLIFTDALAMKGVSGNTSVCLQALKAGNDLLLVPRHLKEEFPAVLEAVEKGELSREEIDAKCRKVLTYKYILGLERKPHVQLSGLATRVNTPQTRDLIHRLNLAAITVLNNQNDVLPMAVEEKRKIALLEVGKPGEMDALAKQLSRYVTPVRFRLRPQLTEVESRRLSDSLSVYNRVIVAVSEPKSVPYQAFLKKFAPSSPAIYLFFTPEKTLLETREGVSSASSVVLAHTSVPEVQRYVADILFAKASVNGRLSASIEGLFHAGDGVAITPATPLHLVPEEYGLSSLVLKRIDSIALAGIRERAYPGCQVVVMKEGHILLDKSFGTHTGAGSPQVKNTDIYDIASLTKTSGTLLALMKLYDKGRFNLTDKLSRHLSFLQQTNKKDITIQDVLFHQSGLPAGLALYPEVIDKESYQGRLFSSRRDAHHTARVGTRTWANPNFKFLKEYISPVKTGNYTWQICDSLWLNSSFREVLEKKIAEASIGQKRYVYSDVGFILLRFLVEQLAGMPMDAYLQQEFYEPMGLKRTGYLPLRKFSRSEIVPSNRDAFLRKAELHGHVHDETAAFQGGISGNAGLFSTAEEVARIYQMLLNDGELDGRRYLGKETCQLFTTSKSKLSRRGLGFDRPDSHFPDKSPCAPSAPAAVYGHTGFTGTCAWVDPVNKIVYVFLSNRIYPDILNRKLSQLDIRRQMHEVIYEAMKKK